MKTHVAILMLCGACGAPSERYFDQNTFNPDVISLVYTPDPGMEQVTEDALAILQNATGNEFTIGPNGVTIHGVPVLRSTSNDELCGNTPTTYWRTGVEHPQLKRDADGTETIIAVHITVALAPTIGCWDTSSELAHEIIHSLRRKLMRYEDNVVLDHTQTGLFQTHATPNDNKLDTPSLLKICEAIDCALFNPHD